MQQAVSAEALKNKKDNKFIMKCPLLKGKLR